MTSISTTKREVEQLRDRLAPKKETWIAWLDPDGSFKVRDKQYACVEDYKGDAELILLTWADP